MTPHPQQEYIITGKQLTDLILATDMPGDWLELEGKIRSHPYNPQAEWDKVPDVPLNPKKTDMPITCTGNYRGKTDSWKHKQY